MTSVITVPVSYSLHPGVWSYPVPLSPQRVLGRCSVLAGAEQIADRAAGDLTYHVHVRGEVCVALEGPFWEALAAAAGRPQR